MVSRLGRVCGRGAGELTVGVAAGRFDVFEPAGDAEDAQPATTMTIATPAARIRDARRGREITLLPISKLVLGIIARPPPIAHDIARLTPDYNPWSGFDAGIHTRIRCAGNRWRSHSPVPTFARLDESRVD